MRRQVKVCQGCLAIHLDDLGSPQPHHTSCATHFYLRQPNHIAPIIEASRLTNLYILTRPSWYVVKHLSQTQVLSCQWTSTRMYSIVKCPLCCRGDVHTRPRAWSPVYLVLCTQLARRSLCPHHIETGTPSLAVRRIAQEGHPSMGVMNEATNER